MARHSACSTVRRRHPLAVPAGHRAGHRAVAVHRALALYQRWRQRRAVFDPAYAPSVAVVVPAYNEEKVIVQTIVSLLACDHPESFEIIVGDDGSSDATYPVARETFAGDPRCGCTLGPTAASQRRLTSASNRLRRRSWWALDADTVFARDTILKLSGISWIRTSGRWRQCQGGQPHQTCSRAGRRWSTSPARIWTGAPSTCSTASRWCPAAVGAWRRELIERAGGFTPMTLAEDADLTLAIRKLGYAIVYEDEAVALTEAPDNVRGFNPPALSLDVWHHAGGLEAPRCFVPAALWRIGLCRSAQRDHFSRYCSAGFADSWICC